MAIIKADAYGHGAVAVAKALEAHAPAFGVACIDEAIELRDAGIKKPILLLGGVASPNELDIAVRENFWLMVENFQQVNDILSTNMNSPVKIWLKMDTGMNRLGFRKQHFRDAYEQLQQSDNVKDEIVLVTHLARADELDHDFTAEQISRFKDNTKDMDCPLSIANSAGIMGWEASWSNWNRAGYMMYGASPFSEPHDIANLLKPVMTLVSKVISLRSFSVGEPVGYGGGWAASRPSVIATIAIGYGDGYPRQATNGTPILVNNQMASLAGRVSMDMVTVDVTDIENVDIGSPVELWGSNVSVNKVAECANTTGYELLTRIPCRPQRIYV